MNVNSDLCSYLSSDRCSLALEHDSGDLRVDLAPPQFEAGLPTTSVMVEPSAVPHFPQKLLGDTYVASRSAIVELLRPSASVTKEQPFFCVDSLDTKLGDLRNVADAMRGERAIYALLPYGLDCHDKQIDSMESMAATYLEEVRKKQSRGPYFLGGVCLGGVVAYEMAQQLLTSGEAVGLVVMIDSSLPGPLQYLHDRPFVTEYLDRCLGEILPLAYRSRIEYLVQRIASGGRYVSRSIGLRQNATRLAARDYRHAISSYKAKPFPGRLVQLASADAAQRAYEDRRLAWSSLTPAGLEVRLIPGNHLTMLDGSNAYVLADELQRCLDWAGDVVTGIAK